MIDYRYQSSSVVRALAVGCPFEVWNGSVLRVLGRQRESVAFDVGDEPVHFEDLSALRFADFNRKFADADILQL